MSQELVGVPEVVNLTYYGGDTLTLDFYIPATFVPPNPQWAAQVRSPREATAILATFDIVYNTGTSHAVLVLPAAITKRLVDENGTLYTGSAVAKIWPELYAAGVTSMRRFSGDWDFQLSAVNGSDPVTTLAQGRLLLDGDVTRLTP